MKTCYVSMPFGKKTERETGVTVDFDRLYFEVVKPAVERAGFSSTRSDELSASAVLQRSVFTAILQSDAMIADVSTGNPSVLYELGARHALRRGRTLLLTRQGERLPHSISYARPIAYELDAEGGVTAAAAEELQNRIVAGLRQSGPLASDSPIYEFFPDLRVELAEEPVVTRSYRGKESAWAAQKRAEGEKTRSAVPLSYGVKEVIESVQSVDPVSFLNTLKAYRDASAWDSLIRVCDEASPEIASSPEVIHLVTLALNRRGYSGDQERAIELLEKTVAATDGGGAETLGILGKIYKERYAARGDRQDLERAIHTFQTAFERQSDNFYAGVSLVSLLYEAVARGGDESLRGKLEEFLPRVRGVVAGRLTTGPPDFWEMSAGLHLACLAQDWEGAEDLAELALAAAPSAWMIESAVLELEEIPASPEASNQEGLRKIIEKLRQGVATMEAKVPYA